jgi:hypothetical protein
LLIKMLCVAVKGETFFNVNYLKIELQTKFCLNAMCIY